MEACPVGASWGAESGLGQAHEMQVGSGHRQKAEPLAPAGGWAIGSSWKTCGLVNEDGGAAREAGLEGQRADERPLYPPLQITQPTCCHTQVASHLQGKNSDNTQNLCLKPKIGGADS